MKILFVGLGSIGQRHLRNLRILLGNKCEFLAYRTQGSNLVLNDEMEIDAGLDLSSHYNIQQFYDLQSALAENPDIVFITNPTRFHVSVALEAARKGCHLFIEKPLSHTIENCEKLKEIVEKQKLVTLLGCQFRFHPLLNSLHEQLKTGRIGAVIGARAEWGEYLPHWHPWEDYRRSYSAQKIMGGGAILTLIHPIDYLYWLFGDVDRVHATIQKIKSLETDVDDDIAVITLEFKSGVVGQIHLDYIQSPPVHTLVVWGDNGRVSCDYSAGTLQWESVDGCILTEETPKGFERNTMFIDEIQHFLECVDQRKLTRIPLDDGIAVLEIALHARQDALEGIRYG